jgi:Protein of unknown function (DUF2971)
MNDPFDVYVDDLINTPIKDHLEEQKLKALDLLETDPVSFARITEVDLETVKQLSGLINTKSNTEKNIARSIFASLDFYELDSEFKKMGENLEIERQTTISRFRSTGLFCATRSNKNLLMWAHYGAKHSGVVLGFRPDLARDSFLRLLEPVTYSDIRPTFYDHDVDLTSTLDDAAKQRIGAAINQKIIYTKSSHWAYEEELRLQIPNEVKEGEEASYNKFYPTELEEIYFGCRIKESDKDEIMILAKNCNPKIIMFTTRLAKGSFDLEFDEIK